MEQQTNWRFWVKKQAFLLQNLRHGKCVSAMMAIVLFQPESIPVCKLSKHTLFAQLAELCPFWISRNYKQVREGRSARSYPLPHSWPFTTVNGVQGFFVVAPVLLLPSANRFGPPDEKVRFP